MTLKEREQAIEALWSRLDRYDRRDTTLLAACKVLRDDSELTQLREENERLKGCEKDNALLEGENNHLSSIIANRGGPCLYCNLPFEDWAKCESGFPGCMRADDAVHCRHVLTSYSLYQELTALRTVAAKLAEACRMVKHLCYSDDGVLQRHSATTIECRAVNAAIEALAEYDAMQPKEQ